MKLYQIRTEDKNFNKIQELLNVAFDGYTINSCFGSWKRQLEASLVIEILTDDKELVYAVAEKIKELNDQESVLVIELPCDFDFV